MKTVLLYGIVSSTKTQVRCVFCDVHIPKASKCIEQHTNGAKHKEAIDIMLDNGINYSDDKLFCKLCKEQLKSDESVIKHIESNDHVNWIVALADLIDGEFIILDSYLKSDKDKDDVYCEACKCNLKFTLQSLEEHVNNYNHRANLAEKVKPLNGLFAVDNDEELWCKVCDEYIDNKVQSILDHIDNFPDHIEWFAKVEDLITDHDMSFDEFLTNEHHNKVFCRKCNMDVLCDTIVVEDHIISETHLNQLFS